MKNKKLMIFLVIPLLLAGGIFISYKKNYYNIIYEKFNNLLKKNIKNTNIINEVDEDIFIELYQVNEVSENFTFVTYGMVISTVTTPIVSEYGGKINFLSETSFVKKGQICVAFDTKVLETELKTHKENLKIEQKQLKRLKDLYSSDLVSIAQIEQTEAKVKTLENKVAEYEHRIKTSYFFAPEDGYFFMKNNAFNVDSVVPPRHECGWFFSKRQLIKFNLPQEYSKYVKQDDTLKLIFLPEYSTTNKPLKGVLKINFKYLHPLAPNENKYENTLLEALGILEDKDCNQFTINKSGQVKIIFNYVEKSILVPETAVFNRGVKNYVYVVQDGYCILNEVKILENKDNGFVKVSGVSNNSKIILRGTNKVYHMLKIKDSNIENVFLDNKDKNNKKDIENDLEEDTDNEEKGE